MAIQDLVIRSQLIAPRQRKGVMRRPRLESALLSALDSPVVLVHAGTGYGKSTALSALTGMVEPLLWYTITEPDRDPLLFLSHMICAFEQEQPAGCAAALGILEENGWRVTPGALTPLLNALTTRPDRDTVLVLDDYHLVGDVSEIAALVERFVEYSPPTVHLVISSRHAPALPSLSRWRAKGRLLALTRAELAFSADEVAMLFRSQYDCPITVEQAQRLTAETEGWAIALQMVGRSLQSGVASSLADILGRLPATLDSLFDYLADDVLARQPEALQRFLVTTSVLREMQGPACDHLLGMRGSVAMLRRLYEDGLFVVSLGDDVYRYQRLFHDFLRAHLQREPARWRDLHERAAVYFRSAGQFEESVHHLLEAGEHSQAAEILEQIGSGLVALGRLDSLSAWIARLPAEMQAAHPALDVLLGDVLRLRARFDEALLRYQAAESRYAQHSDRLGHSRSLRGQAQVYLDTVRPLKADSLLEDALRLLEPMVHRDETSTLLDLLAENKLNLGLPEAAEALHHEAGLLRTDADPGEPYLEARAMLRTGRLAEARSLLELRAEEEGQADASRPQRFHRETLLLLSLILVLQGDADAAERRAQEGIAIGQQLKSPFVEAVGQMRLGHALQLREAQPWEGAPRTAASGWWRASPNVRQAEACYERSMDQVRSFNVLRTYVEPLWGLCRIHGYGGELARARRHADEALEIGSRAGDEWICDLVRVTMGASYAQHGVSSEAHAWLDRAMEGFERVGDPFGRAACTLWLALDGWWSGDRDGALQWLSQLLPVVRDHSWDRLLVGRTLLGPKDDQAALPLLMEGCRQGIEVQYLGRLLETLGLSGAEYHPGYTLWVQTLGSFAVWRGDTLVPSHEWQREKARHIFQLLLAYRGQWLYREQIADHLWPNLAPDAADRDFRVALNSLSRALEPTRPRNAATFFVTRRGSLYGLNPVAGVRVDAVQFEQLAGRDDPESLRRAAALYDDYLRDCLYADWSAAERERLRDLYLAASERLARHLLSAKDWPEAVRVCEEILLRDNCREAIYRVLMRAYAAQGDRARLQNVYERCVTALREELDVQPSESTTSLFERLS